MNLDWIKLISSFWCQNYKYSVLFWIEIQESCDFYLFCPLLTLNLKFLMDAKKPSQHPDVSSAHFEAVKPYTLNVFLFEKVMLDKYWGLPLASCSYDPERHELPVIVLQPQNMYSAPTSSGASSKKIEEMWAGLSPNSIHQSTPWQSAVNCDLLQ